MGKLAVCLHRTAQYVSVQQNLVYAYLKWGSNSLKPLSELLNVKQTFGPAGAIFRSPTEAKTALVFSKSSCNGCEVHPASRSMDTGGVEVGGTWSEVHTSMKCADVTNGRSCLTFRGSCIVIYSYNKSQQDSLLLNFISVKNSTCFGQTYCPSLGVLILYSQQLVFVIVVMLTVRNM